MQRAKEVPPPDLHVLVVYERRNTVEAIGAVICAAVPERFRNGRLELQTIEVKGLRQIIDVVKILHPTGKLEALQNSVQLLCDGAFDRIGHDLRRIEALKLCFDRACLCAGNNNVSDADINAERNTNILDIPGDLRADTVILPIGGNRFRRERLEGDEIIAGRNSENLCNDFIHSHHIVR